jgi:alanine dehydrogenase
MVDITFVTAAELQAVGAELTTEDIHDAVDNAWREIRSGQAIGGKAVLSLREDDFWKTEQFAPFRESFSDERLGWKLSSLYSVNSRYAGVKIIGANAFNRRLGLPRSTSTFLLLEKFTLRPIVILDGTVLSAVRTGTYASVVAQRCIRSKTGTSVFIFGAGPVARSVVQSLDYALGDKITRFFVRSRTIESARSLTLSLAEETTIPLEPVCDNRSLRECAFVVTASNARYPFLATRNSARRPQHFISAATKFLRHIFSGSCAPGLSHATIFKPFPDETHKASRSIFPGRACLWKRSGG